MKVANNIAKNRILLIYQHLRAHKWGKYHKLKLVTNWLIETLKCSIFHHRKQIINVNFVKKSRAELWAIPLYFNNNFPLIGNN